MSQKIEVTMLSEIKSIGIELEGSWCKVCVNPLLQSYKDKLHIKGARDISVDTRFSCVKHSDYYIQLEAEIKAWVTVKELPLMFQFVKELFATKAFRQDNSCGNHIHVRFKRRNIYKTFALKETWNKFIQEYRKMFSLAKYIRRLSNYYADSSWEPNLERDERRHNHDKRYMMINHQSLYEPQHTLEFRILPYFKDANEAINAYSSLLEVINELAIEGKGRN